MEEALSHSTGCLERNSRGCRSTSAVTPKDPQTEERFRNMPEKVCDAPSRVSSFLIEDLLRSSKRDDRKATIESGGFCKDRGIASHCDQVQGHVQNLGLSLAEGAHISKWCGSPHRSDLRYVKSEWKFIFECTSHVTF